MCAWMSRAGWGMTLVMGLGLVCGSGTGWGGGAEGAALPKVRVNATRTGFETTEGRPFVPWGVNYYRPGTGWAPQVWKAWDAEATRRDLRRLRELGGNCVRVFLTLGSFHSEPGGLDEEGMRKLEAFMAMAAAEGIYVHPTGPDHWEGIPEWARTDRIADETFLKSLEGFWRRLAMRLKGRGEVFAYDLLNEPAVSWDTPRMRERWNRWLEARYPRREAMAAAWGWKETPPSGAVEIPDERAARLDRRFLDFQMFREELAEIWTSRQAAAIREADPEALVTVGLVQWSVPFGLGEVRQYAGFRPERVAAHVDFLSFHYYPLAGGVYRYEGAGAERRNLMQVEALAWECARWGRPVVLGEFGWYGGGRPASMGEGPAGREEDQAQWCRAVVDQTRGLVSGWLNWGFYDHPQARDVSEYTGLLRTNGEPKAWGREFLRLSGELGAR